MVLLELTRGKHQHRIIQRQETDVNSSPWNGISLGRSRDSYNPVKSNILIGYIP